MRQAEELDAEGVIRTATSSAGNDCRDVEEARDGGLEAAGEERGEGGGGLEEDGGGGGSRKDGLERGVGGSGGTEERELFSDALDQGVSLYMREGLMVRDVFEYPIYFDLGFPYQPLQRRSDQVFLRMRPNTQPQGVI